MLFHIVFLELRVIELPEIICEVFLGLRVYIFLRRKAILGWIPSKQSLKQGFGCIRELHQRKGIKESRIQQGKEPREDVFSTEVQL